MMLAKSFSMFLDILPHHAAEHGSRLAFRFLVSGDVTGDYIEWTYEQLDQRARAIAAMLQDAGAQGERVLLLYPPGIEFIAGFLACLYAGATAVPTYPPDPGRLDRTLPRLRAIARDCQAGFVLTSSPLLAMAPSLMPQAPELARLHWMASDRPPDDASAAWKRPDVNQDTTAFLQYTSGSTGTPKGVIVTHGNILHNERLIAECFGLDTDSILVGWLPLFHDMGLIGNVLHPLYLGFPCTLMSPLAFLGRPFRWLQAISHFRATASGGPNFAYDLCVRKISDEERASLDLASWSVAFNGAEPLRAETLDRFTDAFAPCGFRRAAFFPCYGLAEATLFVTGSSKNELPVCATVDANALADGHIVAVEPSQIGGGGTSRLVSSGSVMLDQQVIIVDPETRVRCAPGRVGEIWIASPSVARGYWNRPDDSMHTFAARLAEGSEGTFLRTGDLGALEDGQLFVTGRLKDLIIVRGRNYYPQELEELASASHPAVRPGSCAAFAIDEQGGERVVVVAETRPGTEHEAAAIAAAVRAAVWTRLELHIDFLVLIRPGSLPKTSSGKIQRRACRAAYLAGTLPVVADSGMAGGSLPPSLAPLAVLDDGLRAISEPAEREERLIAALCGEIARLLGGSLYSRIDPDAPLATLGLDSLHATELAGRIEETTGIATSAVELFRYESLGALARALSSELTAGPNAPAPQSWRSRAEPQDAGETAPLSPEQRRMWILDLLYPGSALYNIALALALRGVLRVDALSHALDELVRAHASLRTVVIADGNGEPVQRILPAVPVAIERVELDTLAPAEQEARLAELRHAYAVQPFDLTRGPLVHACLVRLAADRHELLLTIHHIAADGWSFRILARDLEVLYAAHVVGQPGPAAGSHGRYADHARALASMPPDALASRVSYWRERLAGAPTMVALPVDRLCGTEAGLDGAVHSMTLLAEPVRSFARREGATLFTVLLAAFDILLARLTGQHDLVIGVPISRRPRAHERTVGMFINTVAVRVDMSGDPCVRELVQRTRQRSLEAFASADVPLERVVEAVRPGSRPDGAPLFNVLFGVQPQPPTPRLLDLDIELSASQSAMTHHDLTVAVHEGSDELRIEWVYRTALFDAGTVERMAERMALLLQAMAAHPELPVSELARWRHDGTLEQLGRSDEQVRLHGVRIDVGAIEATLAGHPRLQVREAAIIAREDTPGDPYLCAYLVADGAAPRPNEIREHLTRKLPAYMVPARVVLLQAGLPRMPDGALDRAALPAPPPEEGLDPGEAAQAPRTPVEETLCRLAAQVLGVESVGIHEDFFDLGVQSLHAAMFVVELQTIYGVEISIRDLFENPTVARLSALVQARIDASGAEEFVL
jgi:acyl-CoA synthetase (AMP-forming)/AMP-acid ligase II/acyl carrier protein